MGQINNNSAVTSYASEYSYRTEQTKKNETAKEAESTAKKHRVSGRTIGEPKLSEHAQKYYDKLRAKYSNMDFILVSSAMKDEAERNKGMYQSSKELLVLIDEDKIEQMAADENIRKKYEGILDNAVMQLNQAKKCLGSNANGVKSYGMTIDDHGNASFFAVVDKSLAKQRDRIEQKRAERAEDKKEAAKEAAEKRAEGKKDGPDGNSGNYVTVTANSWSELFRKINNIMTTGYEDPHMTRQEKALGQNFDYTL